MKDIIKNKRNILILTAGVAVLIAAIAAVVWICFLQPNAAAEDALTSTAAVSSSDGSAASPASSDSSEVTVPDIVVKPIPARLPTGQNGASSHAQSVTVEGDTEELSSKETSSNPNGASDTASRPEQNASDTSSQPDTSGEDTPKPSDTSKEDSKPEEDTPPASEPEQAPDPAPDQPKPQKPKDGDTKTENGKDYVYDSVWDEWVVVDASGGSGSISLEEINSTIRCSQCGLTRNEGCPGCKNGSF